jgi:hypothetical protein
VFAGSDNVDTVYGPGDAITPCVFNLGPARDVDLVMTVESLDGTVFDQHQFPKLPPMGFCAVIYTVCFSKSPVSWRLPK